MNARPRHGHAFVLFVFAALLALLAFAPAFGAPGPAPAGDASGAPIDIAPYAQPGSPGIVPVLRSSEVLLDPAGTLTVDDVRQGPFAARFVPAATLSGVAGSIVKWVRFRIVSPPDAARQWRLLLGQGSDYLDLYEPGPHGTYARVRTGYKIPFAQRPVPDLAAVIDLSPALFHGQTLYARIVGPARSGIYLWALDAEIALREYDELFTILFCGFYFAIAVSSTLLAFYLREGVYAANAAFMASLIVFKLTNSRYAWQFLWPNAAFSYPVANTLAIAAFSVLLTLFARTFLQTRKRFPWLDAFTFVLLGFVVFCEVWYGIFAPTPGTPLQAAVADFFWLLSIVVAGIASWRAGLGAARFFTCGFVAMTAGFLINDLSNAGLIARSELTQQIFDLGIMFDAAMFQFALADLVLTERRNRIFAQQELVRTQKAALERLEVYNRAFARFVPMPFLEQLRRDDVVAIQLGDHVEREMTVLFSDIRSFTTISESMTPKENFDFLNGYLGRIGPIVREHNGFIDKYIGDAVMALFPDDRRRALDAAIALQREVRLFNAARKDTTVAPIAVGVGLHYGLLMLGTIGESERFETTVIADAVNVASRLEGLTKLFGANIIVSREMTAGLESEYRLRPLGEIQVKGTSRPVEVLEVCDSDAPEFLAHKMSTLDRFEAGRAAYASGAFAEAHACFAAILELDPRDRAAAYFRDRAVVMLQASDVLEWDGVERMDSK